MIKDPLITKRKELTKRGCETYSISHIQKRHMHFKHTPVIYFSKSKYHLKKRYEKDLSTICAISDLNFSSTK